MCFRQLVAIGVSKFAAGRWTRRVGSAFADLADHFIRFPKGQDAVNTKRNRRYTEYFCMQCTLIFFLISGIKFFICIRVYFIYRKDLYFLSHVRFIFPNLKSYLFFMNTSCLTAFGCVPHTASFWVAQNLISICWHTVWVHYYICEYIISYFMCILSDVLLFNIIVRMKCYRLLTIHSIKYGTQYISSIL